MRSRAACWTRQCASSSGPGCRRSPTLSSAPTTSRSSPRRSIRWWRGPWRTAAPALAAACTNLRQRNAALLVYHFGRDQGHVLLVGDKGVQAYPLVVSEDLAARVAAPTPLVASRPGETPVVRGLRGFVLDPP